MHACITCMYYLHASRVKELLGNEQVTGLLSASAIIMKALKCKSSAQFAYNYTINVLNMISHRSSVFEGRHNRDTNEFTAIQRSFKIFADFP